MRMHPETGRSSLESETSNELMETFTVYVTYNRNFYLLILPRLEE